MDRYRGCVLLAAAAGLFSLCGASCPWSLRPDPLKNLPAVLPPAPTVEQVMEAVNQRSGQIQSFVGQRASLGGRGFPTLRANLAFERPRRFRLRADSLTGAEMDLGSNDDLFWFWLRRNEPKAMYYCRHEQFASCPARQQIPIDPQWLIEAVGVVYFDPAWQHQGPYPAANGQWEVRSFRQTPDGPVQKSTFVNRLHALVTEQRLYDGRGQLLAKSTVTGFRPDPSGVVMPTGVDIEFPVAGVSLHLELGGLEVNKGPVAGELWAMPVYQGWPAVDLCSPNLRLGPQVPLSGGPAAPTAARPTPYSTWAQH